MQDPWGTPAEEPQQPAPVAAPETAQPQEANPVVGTVDVAVRPVIQPAVDAGKVVLTFKGGTGFDAPWIVVHATDLDDALDHVSADNAGKFIDLMTRVQKVGNHFAGLRPTSQPSSDNINRAPQRQLQPGQPAGSVEAPSWAPPKPYDDFVYVTKVKAETGKTWHAWMPPEKGDTRPPKFFFPPR